MIRYTVMLLVMLLTTALLTLPAAAVSQSMDDDMTEVVVTATRLETPREEVSGSIHVITKEDMENKQARTVFEALKGLPGIDLVNQGGPGKTSSILLRGGDTRFTLVLIDGVEVNDPSNPERTFDFAHMGTEDIERIEVLFGPQSTLYGSDAIGGVIQIITRKGKGETDVSLSAEGGSFGTRKGSVSARGGTERTSWSLTASALETDGISIAAEADGNTEMDGYENITFSGRFEQEVGDSGTVGLNVRSVDARNELDHNGGPDGDDPNFNGDARHLVIGAFLSIFPAEIWESSFSLTRSAYDRHDLNQPDADRNFPMELKFEGRSDKAEWVSNLYLSDNSVVTLGFDTETEAAESSYASGDSIFPFTSTLSEESVTINGVYVQEHYSTSSGLSLTLGARADDHSDFGGETTWRAGFSMPVGSRIRVRSVYGTGFRAPSIDQLYNPDYGNPDLEPETSAGWDAGMEILLGSETRVSLAAHRTKYDNLIAWFDPDNDWMTPDGYYSNVSRTSTEGVDLSLSTAFRSLSFGLDGSLLRTEDEQGEQLLRRPETRWGAQLGFLPSSGISMNLNAIRVGERKEWGNITLPEYTLVNLAGSYRVSERLQFSGRVQNLFDEEYEEAAGYGTPGRATYIGLRADL